MNEKLDPTEIDVHGNNAVHQAAAASRLEVMKLFMSAGIDLDVANDRGHTPFDLATDPDIKSLILKMRSQKQCKGSKCGQSKFTFQNTQFFCQDCKGFYCKKCCVRYPVFWEVDSEKAEKIVCRCDSCQDKVVFSEQRLRDAMATQDFVTLDKVCREILAVKIPEED